MSNEQKIDLSQAINLALNTITQQIRMLSDLPADSCKLAVAGLEPIVGANFSMVADAANDQAEEMNGLITELEARDDEILKHLSARNALQEQLDEALASVEAVRTENQSKIEELETTVFNTQRTANSFEAKLGAANLTLRHVNAELKDLKGMDPAGMKRRIKEKNELLEQQRSAIAQYKSNEAAYRKDITTLEARVKELINATVSQDEELANRQQIIDELVIASDLEKLWGEHLRKHYNDESGQRWNVYLANHGIQTDKPYLLNDLNWKLMAMRQDGLGCIVLVSEWLTPIFPVGDIGREIPMEAINDIHAFMCDAVSKTHPMLMPRAEWAQTVSIHELHLPTKAIPLLEQEGIITLWKVLAYGTEKLGAIKGMGPKMVGQVLNACEMAVKAWEEKWSKWIGEAG